MEEIIAVTIAHINASPRLLDNNTQLAMDAGEMMARCTFRARTRIESVGGGRVRYVPVENEKWAVAVGAPIGVNQEIMGRVTYHFLLKTRKGLVDFMFFK